MRTKQSQINMNEKLSYNHSFIASFLYFVWSSGKFSGSVCQEETSKAPPMMNQTRWKPWYPPLSVLEIFIVIRSSKSKSLVFSILSHTGYHTSIWSCSVITVKIIGGMVQHSLVLPFLRLPPFLPANSGRYSYLGQHGPCLPLISF